MAEQRFNVVASGHPREGFERSAVLAALQQRLKLAPAQAAQLLAGQPVTVKRAVPAATATAYSRQLRSLGLAVDMAPLAAATADPAPVPATAAWFEGASTPHPHLRADLHWLAAAGLALLIPLAYAGALLLLLALLAAHALGNQPWLQAPPWWWNGPLYFLPLLAGALLLAALLRPLWPAPRPAPEATIPPEQEPLLWQLLRDCAQAAGVPPPARLVLTAGADCHCELRPGGAGWRRGECVLQLGLARLRLPAAAWLPGIAAALAGATPVAARSRRLIDGIEGWLHRNIGRRDGLSPRLERHPASAWLEHRFARGRDALFTALLRIHQRLALGARRTALSGADRAAARLTGAAAFADWRRAELRLARAADWAQRTAARTPVDNLPALIAHAASHPDPAAEADMEQRLKAPPPLRQRRLPTERERIETVAMAALPGTLNAPAEAPPLLRDGAREQSATLAHYRRAGVDATHLHPLETVLDKAELARERSQLAAAYFNGWLRRGRGWQLPEAALIHAMPVADAAAQLHVCVNEIRRLTPDRTQLLAQWERLSQQLAELQLGQQLLAAQVPFTFRLNAWDGGPLPPLLAAKQTALDQVARQLALQESIMGGRLAMGLRLSGQAEAESADLHASLQFLGALAERLTRLRQEATLLAGLLERRGNTHCRDAAARLGQRLAEGTAQLLARLDGAPTPPECRYALLSEYVRGRLPAGGTDAGAALARARALDDALWRAHEALSALAAEWAAGSEEAYKIERIRRLRETS